MTKEVFEAAKGRLKVVGRAGVGVDNVDLNSATEVLQVLMKLTDCHCYIFRSKILT